ncbi:hypothetical protein CASFOL_039714 [Castilleja foliolosa]|uniref:S-protein homolog n=1 Tax=Castilleja foliolosa TaxID=1961234 RepID=A0ABD3BGJ6_9LAMI
MKILQLFVVYSILFYKAQSRCMFNRVTFYVVNKLSQSSPPIDLHCASGDRELGYHNIGVGQNFSYSFCTKFRALYFCHLWWRQKDVAFEVWNHNWHSSACGFTRDHPKTCYWEARDDGVYLAAQYPPQSFDKLHNWSTHAMPKNQPLV